jgi:biopolymer transport protein ExbB
MGGVPRAADVAEFVALGGAVMPALIALGVATWAALLWRWFEFGPGQARRVEEQMRALAAAPGEARARRWKLRVVAERARQRLRRLGAGTDAMIAAAPLLGLLGTISGMIDTFDVLHVDQALARSEAMARGISKALITTEFGLFVSIPAIVMSRALRRREAHHEHRIDEVEARLASAHGEEA